MIIIYDKMCSETSLSIYLLEVLLHSAPRTLQVSTSAPTWPRNTSLMKFQEPHSLQILLRYAASKRNRNRFYCRLIWHRLKRPVLFTPTGCLSRSFPAAKSNHLFFQPSRDTVKVALYPIGIVKWFAVRISNRISTSGSGFRKTISSDFHY